MQLSINLKLSKKAAATIVAVLVLIAAGIIFYLEQANRDPLPPNLKKQVTYKIAYPSKISQIDTGSYQYQADKQVLNFNVATDDSTVVFTEQPAPSALGSDTQAYYPALGIHPYAQFQTKLGLVVLTRFWQAGNFKPVGQSAILATHGTFLIAHSEKNLTNAEWKDLFESLKLAK